MNGTQQSDSDPFDRQNGTIVFWQPFGLSFAGEERKKP